jgi:hypothetical protein
MKGRSPTAAEKRHLNSVAELGCIVCKIHEGTYTPAEIHHIDGKTKPRAHFNVLPLCYWHHRGNNDCETFTSRHPYKSEFESRYGTETDLLKRVEEFLSKG